MVGSDRVSACPVSLLFCGTAIEQREQIAQRFSGVRRDSDGPMPDHLPSIGWQDPPVGSATCHNPARALGGMSVLKPPSF